jgi:hypothetical protein
MLKRIQRLAPRPHPASSARPAPEVVGTHEGDTLFVFRPSRRLDVDGVFVRNGLESTGQPSSPNADRLKGPPVPRLRCGSAQKRRLGYCSAQRYHTTKWTRYGPATESCSRCAFSSRSPVPVAHLPIFTAYLSRDLSARELPSAKVSVIGVENAELDRDDKAQTREAILSVLHDEFAALGLFTSCQMTVPRTTATRSSVRRSGGSPPQGSLVRGSCTRSTPS